MNYNTGRNIHFIKPLKRCLIILICSVIASEVLSRATQITFSYIYVVWHTFLNPVLLLCMTEGISEARYPGQFHVCAWPALLVYALGTILSSSTSVCYCVHVYDWNIIDCDINYQWNRQTNKIILEKEKAVMILCKCLLHNFFSIQRA